MHLWALRGSNPDPRQLFVKLKKYTPPPALRTAPGHRPLAVVVMHANGDVKIAYSTHSLDGVEKMARRYWVFINDWNLPMAVYVDTRDARGLVLYEPLPFETTQCRPRGGPIDEYSDARLNQEALSLAV